MALTPQQVTGKKLGSYELTKEVSASSVGATFGAKSASGELVLVTKIHRHVAKSAQLVDNFVSEAKNAAALDAPQIAKVVDSGVADGEPFVAYANGESETLASLLRRAGPEGLPLPVATRILLDVLEALEAAHLQNAALGHGELGPWCIHIGADGHASVSGFGVDRAISRFGLHYVKNLERLTYAAPERVKAMSLTLGPTPPVPDAKSDTFSVAVLGWELLSRQRLFSSRMEAAIIQKVLTGPIADLSAQRPEVPSAISEAIASALSRDPASRPSLGLLVAAVSDGDVAAHSAVAEFAGHLVDKSQTRAVSGAPRAFASVRPPPPAAPVAAKITNGAGAPLRTPARAKTIMGMAAPVPPAPKPATPAPAPTTPKPTTPKPATATPASTLENPTTLDEDFLVEETSVDEPAAPPKRSAAPPPPKRPPVKPRQQTLLGVEPLGPPVDISFDPPPTKEAPAAAPITAPSAAPEPFAKALDATPEPTAPIGIIGQRSLDRLRGGATLGKNPGEIYELLEAVARGGMATVWAARASGASGLDQLVAIKTMLPELSDDPDFESMFLDEMRVAAKVKHPNVAQILSLGEEDEVMYLVMEWVDGDTIGAIQRAARSDGGIPLPILLRIARDLCAGLHAAHETKDDSGSPLDLVHRDVNPANVLVDRNGVAKILDFGIAKSKGRLHVTRVGSTVKGKTPYLSPEQLGGLALDRRSDLFSLGALLYVMATGLHPFRGDSELKTVENIALKAAAPLRSIVPDIHPDFENLVLRLLEKEPKKRFATAADVEKDLERIEQILEKPASHDDVGAFVRKAVGDVLEARAQSLIDALARVHPADAAAVRAKVANGVSAASLATPLFPDDSTTLDLPPKALDASPVPASVDPPAEPAAAVDPFEMLTAPAAPVTMTSAVIDDEPTQADAAAPIEMSVPDAPAAEPQVFDDEDPIASAAPSRSPWIRLAVLVVVGVGVGIGIIAMIEALRGPATPPAGTASAVVAQPTAPPTPTPMTAAPIPTVEPTATAEPSAAESAEPAASAEPSAEPSAEATTAPTATVPHPYPTGARPPSTGVKPKPKPKPYNPTTI